MANIRTIQPRQEYTFEDLLDPVKLARAAEQVKLDSRRAAEPQVRALLAAGWKYELPALDDSEPWQWYWRRPPRRKNSKGMFFWSTQQAYNALMRALKD